MVDHNLSPTHDLPQPSHLPPGGRALGGYQHRRSLLAGIGATAIVAVPAAAEAAADPVIGWHREWRRLVDWWNSPADPTKDSSTHPTWFRIEELEALIAATPATSAAGMLCQIDVALQALGEGEPCHECIQIEERVLVALRTSLAGRA